MSWKKELRDSLKVSEGGKKEKVIISFDDSGSVSDDLFEQFFSSIKELLSKPIHPHIPKKRLQLNIQNSRKKRRIQSLVCKRQLYPCRVCP